MFSKLEKDTVLALCGLVCFLAGIYLWFGLPPTLVLLGGVLMYAGWRLPEEQHESYQDVISHQPEVYPGE